MENHEKSPSFQMLMLVTTPKLADKAAAIFHKSALPIQYRLNAEGTASSEIMDMLGLGSIDKCVFISTMPKRLSDIMLRKLRSELHLGSANSGIAFTIPLTGANNRMLRMLTHIDEESQADHKGKDGYIMMETNYVLIAAIVNMGFSADVMNAARAAGANGGTVMHSRWMGNEEVTGFWGLSVQAEKDIVLILSETEKKVEIMRQISEKCGVHTEAQGIVMSLPIDSVMGI